jgi:hypothetical protein
MSIERLTKLAALALLLVGGAGLAEGGCAGELDDPGRFLCVAVEADFFPNTCGLSGCHNATDHTAGLDLVSPGLASRVRNAPASSSCMNQILADPAHPEESLLYTKLRPSPPCGLQMPYRAEAVSDKQLECVRDWIAALPAGSGGSGGTGGTGGAGGTVLGGAGGMAGAGGQ